MKVKGQTIQGFLKGLVRDVNLPKVSAVFLGLKMKSRNMIETNVTFSWYKYCKKEAFLVYCIDTKGLIENLGTTYNPCEWCLFIDCSKRNSKAV